MNIFILQKSIADIKSPTIRKPYETNAATLGEFICEMVDISMLNRYVRKTDKREITDLVFV